MAHTKEIARLRQKAVDDLQVQVRGPAAVFVPVAET